MPLRAPRVEAQTEGVEARKKTQRFCYRCLSMRDPRRPPTTWTVLKVILGVTNEPQVLHMGTKRRIRYEETVKALITHPTGSALVEVDGVEDVFLGLEDEGAGSEGKGGEHRRGGEESDLVDYGLDKIGG